MGINPVLPIESFFWGEAGINLEGPTLSLEEGNKRVCPPTPLKIPGDGINFVDPTCPLGFEKGIKVVGPVNAPGSEGAGTKWVAAAGTKSGILFTLLPV